MTQQCAQFFPGGGIPKDNFLIVTRGGEHRLITIQHGVVHRVAVAFEHRDLLPVGDRPDARLTEQARDS